MKYAPFLFIGLGLACFILFAAFESSVAPNGQLLEPFPLLPLGWLFIAIGTCGLIASIVLRIWRR